MRALVAVLLCAAALIGGRETFALDAGIGRINITPEFPVRLSGYGNRTTNHQAVAQPIWAKALALGSGKDAALLITIDNCAISAAFGDDVAARIKTRFGIPRERIAFCVTHTHSAPMLSGVIPNLFSSDINPEQQAAIDRYTRELADKLAEVGAVALNDRKPAKVSWSEGTVSFAMNRRAVRGSAVQLGINMGGPVDHSLPVLVVRDERGEEVRAVWAGYACHCTTMGGEFNQVHGDWAGCAAEQIERQHPGAVALVSIGCGGDANPNPRGKVELAEAHGRELAQEVKRMLALPQTELPVAPQCRFDRFDIDFQALPSRAEWEQRAQQKGIVGYHARKNLARLDRGETLPTTLPYTAQTWSFGTNLAIVFLAGEVVIDYQLRLKREFDRERVWVNGYANDVPCYIPSARVLREGGYEAQDSLWYYDRPTRLSTNIEERIVRKVHELMPAGFLANTNAPQAPKPLAPSAALKSIRVANGLVVDCVAHEPLVIDPVAIDWGADGKLWVAEMRDYPMGIDGNWKPGGVVKYLRDTNSDGRYDIAQEFLGGLPFPTGVFAWRKGVLICAAPDIIYAEDTNDDGRADVVRKVFGGFETNNYQARVNSLSLGLDNWIYGANGLLGGVIRGTSGTNAVDIRGRDFRMKPDTGAFEPVSGLTQQGRVRDDFGNWFGCDNSRLVLHFPLPDRYARRNPFVSAPAPAVHTPRGPDWNRLYPSSRTLERFNDAQSANRVTSACGLEIYRGDLLGAAYTGNAFVCESVHNLVHREVLSPDGLTFTSTRAAGEENAEFFSSSDNWCRPVQARTGPDGALWIVDMYRYVIEHPRWISSNRLATLNVRAGDDKGRIYRVYSTEHSPRQPIRSLSKLSAPELAALLDSASGTERDRVHRELLNRNDRSALPVLRGLASSAKNPAVRIQALSALSGLGGVTHVDVLNALSDRDPHVRAFAVELAEAFASLPPVAHRLVELRFDPSVTVRYQAALNSGNLPARDTGEILSALAVEATTNRWMRAALLASATNCAAELLSKAVDNPVLAAPLLETILGVASPAVIQSAVASILPKAGEPITTARLTTIAALADRASGGDWIKATDATHLFDHALEVLKNEQMAPPARQAALRVLGASGRDEGLATIAQFLAPNVLQSNALSVLTRSRSPRVPGLIVTAWSHLTPAQREIALTALTSRPEWRAPVFRAVEQGEIAAGEFPIALRNQLRESSDTRDLARKLWPQRSGNKSETWALFENALAGEENRANGRAVFERACASCHHFRGLGYAVGPDLAPLHDKTPHDFLLAILDPNAAVEPRFLNYNVELRDGRSLSGVIRGESASGFTLVQGGGVEHAILRRDVLELRASTLSPMPEGLEQGISPTEMRDLIAFIKTPPPRPFGTGTPAQVQLATELLGRSTFTLIFSSERLDYPGMLGRLPFWHCRQSDGLGRVEWEGSGRPTADGSHVEFLLPAAMGLNSQPRGKFSLHVNGRALLDFDVSLADASWTSADGTVRMNYEVAEANSEDSSGILRILLPKSLANDGRARFQVTGSRSSSQRWFGIYEMPLTSKSASARF